MPSIAVKRKYEAIYIIKPDSVDEQINATIQRYRKVVEKAGGVVEKTGVWERRKLAYEIRGYNEGIFVLLNFTGEASVEAELRRVFQISTGEDQIRYMIVKPEDVDTGRPAVDVTEKVHRPSPSSTPAPSPVVVTTPEAVAEIQAAASVAVAAEPVTEVTPVAAPEPVSAAEPAVETETPAEPEAPAATEA
jgi:small subunit ribosomal protein S6